MIKCQNRLSNELRSFSLCDIEVVTALDKSATSVDGSVLFPDWNLCWEEVATLDGEDADNLIFSLAYAFNKQDGFEAFRAAVDDYLKVALTTKQYLITVQKKDPEGKSETSEAVIH
jgi:hypothetical protein